MLDVLKAKGDVYGEVGVSRIPIEGSEWPLVNFAEHVPIEDWRPGFFKLGAYFGVHPLGAFQKRLLFVFIVRFEHFGTANPVIPYRAIFDTDGGNPLNW
jgi:hypothetical protein